ncbi:MAG: ABC transporter permease protein NatB [Calditrichaeota bacterium]|nr:ABC transporter permease protein NatB [Calditrichota bacterium]
MATVRVKNIGAVWRKELLDIVRDRRTLISMVVVPIVLIPVLMIGAGAVMASAMKNLEAQSFLVATLHPERAPRLEAAIEAVDGLDVVSVTGTPLDTVRAQVERGTYQAAVVFPEDNLNDPATQPPVIVLSRQDREKSQIAVRRLDRALDDLQAELTAERLAAYGAPASVAKPFEIVEHNLASNEQVALSALASFLPYILIIVTMTGAMYPAIDMTAGEKERGTLETLLASPVGRLEIVLGKFLAVTTTSIVSATLSLLSLFLVLAWGMSYIAAQVGETLTISLPSGGTLLAAFAMMLPLAALFASLLLTICMFAKSTREAQSYIQPLMILIIIPAMMSMLPGSEGAGGDAWTPVVNVSLAIKGILTDNYDPSFVGQTILATALYALIGITISYRTFQRESVLFRV